MIPSVWAPYPERVDLVVEGQRRPMRRDERHWWHSDVELGPGTDYAFSLDGGDPLPDPRSRHQPHGVHGPSRVYRPSARTDERWHGFDLAGSVLYEMHIGTFSPEGTFAGAAQRLDHLVELGVDAVEVMPVNQFSGRHGWGYDGVDLYAVHHPYGGPDAFRHFVSDCHDRGLGVILDVVYNHLGPLGNHLGRFGPYFTDTYRTPWGEAVNLDGPDSDEVRSFLFDNALMWLGDYGVDGLRVDAVHAFFDRSAIHFLEELATEVEALQTRMGRPLWVIAESDLNDPRLVWPRERGGYELDATWSDDFHHSLHTLLTGEQNGYYRDFGRLQDLAAALTSVYVYDGKYSEVRRRRHGRPVEGLAATRFLGYIQNHDQVGNRARGERIGHLVDEAGVYLASALVLTAPFVPMIFQGEEWAASSPFPYFSDHDDPELAEAVSQGRRREFASLGWDPDQVPDPQAEDTFRSAILDWEERSRSPHREVLEWYRRLIELRHRTPELNDGRLEWVLVHADEGDSTLVMERGRLVLALNLSSRERTVDVHGHPVRLPSHGVALLALRENGLGENGLRSQPR